MRLACMRSRAAHLSRQRRGLDRAVLDRVLRLLEPRRMMAEKPLELAPSRIETLPRSVLASLRNLAHLAAELSHRSSRRIGRGSEVRRKRLAQCRSRSLEARAQPLDLSSTRPTDISRHEVQLACS